MKKDLIYNMADMEQPCIYLLYKKDFKGARKNYYESDDKVVYVGQSKRGIERIFEHKKDKQFDYVKVIPCKLSKLDETEKRYIDFYKPTYNTKLIKGECKAAGWHNTCFNCKYAGKMKDYDTEELKGTYITCAKEKRPHHYWYWCECYKYKRI